MVERLSLDISSARKRCGVSAAADIKAAHYHDDEVYIRQVVKASGHV